MKLSDAQWEMMREHFPGENIPDGRAGRTPVPRQAVLVATFWILNTGEQWHMLPQCYPNYKAVHHCFQKWCRSDVLRNILIDFANKLREQWGIDVRESCIDAMFCEAKGEGRGIGKTKRGKGVKIMGIVNRNALPIEVTTHAANHHDVILVQLRFDFYMIEAKPEKLIGGKAYDSDTLDEKLAEEGIEMIAPHRENPLENNKM